MGRDAFVCPICRKRKHGEMFHCHDHCMDMCRDHVSRTGEGLFFCVKCEKPVQRFVYNGRDWEEK